MPPPKTTSSTCLVLSRSFLTPQVGGATYHVVHCMQLGQLVEMEQCLVEEVDSEDQQELTEESLKLFRFV